MRWLNAALWAVLLVCLWPFVSVLLASAIASWADCELNEGSVNPCVIAGRDWGPQLARMFVRGWYMLLTMPVALFALVGLVVLAIVRRTRA